MKKIIIYLVMFAVFFGYVIFIRATEPPPPTIIFPGSTMSPAFVNQPYQTTIQVVGGLAPYTFSVSAGSLPQGLSLNSSTGVISGTPNNYWHF